MDPKQPWWLAALIAVAALLAIGGAIFVTLMITDGIRQGTVVWAWQSPAPPVPATVVHR